MTVVRSVALALLLLLLPALSAPLSAARLLPDEVSCNRQQLNDLLDRIELTTPAQPGASTAVFATYSSRFGFFQGLALTSQWPTSTANPPMPEHHLAFSLNPTLREILLNPERLPLAQIGIAREESGTDRLPAGARGTLRLTLDPTAGAGSPAAARLVINNLGTAEPGARTSDSKPGRGLAADGITSPCHTALSELDLTVLTLLQRTLRVRALGGTPVRSKIALYRGKEEGRFIAEARLFGGAGGGGLGTVVVELTVETDPAGRLAGGTIALGAPCGPGVGAPCTQATLSAPIEIFLVAPSFPGRTVWEPTAPDSVRVVLDPGAGGGNPSDAAVSWNALLAETTWNRRIRFAERCGLGNPEDLAATPRAAPGLEILAIRLSGAVAAPADLYRRLSLDAAAIADEAPAAETGGIVQPAVEPSTIGLTVGALTYDAMVGGSYTAWDCLNSWYESVDIRFAPGPGAGGTVRITFGGVYDTAQVAAEYAALPGVQTAGTVAAPASPYAAPPRLCATAEGNVIHYVATGPAIAHPVGKPRPVEFYYFVGTAPGEVTLEDTYNALSDPFIQPPWASLYGDC